MECNVDPRQAFQRLRALRGAKSILDRLFNLPRSLSRINFDRNSGLGACLGSPLTRSAGCTAGHRPLDRENGDTHRGDMLPWGVFVTECRQVLGNHAPGEHVGAAWRFRDDARPHLALSG